MAVKGITVLSPSTTDGHFKLTEGIPRVEQALNFVLMFYGVTREYKEYFTTRFLLSTVQRNSAVVDPSLILLQLKSLLNESIPEFRAENSSFNRANLDRKSLELMLEYLYVDPDTGEEVPQVQVKFIPFNA